MKLLHTISLPGPLGTVLQPIVRTSGGAGSIFAVECLTRGPRGTKLEDAVPLFEYVRRHRLEVEMDCACVARALRIAAGYAPRLTINVHPATLGGDRKFVAFLLRQAEAAHLDPRRLIVEVGEHAPAADARAFAAALTELRMNGIAIALDDVGYGHSNYKAILDCQADYLKIDRYFVDGVSADEGKRAVVRSILDLAAVFGAEVVAEGLETRADLEVLGEMGIDLFQGFLFSRPVTPLRYASNFSSMSGSIERISGTSSST